jgi:hypothetical protein
MWNKEISLRSLLFTNSSTSWLFEFFILIVQYEKFVIMKLNIQGWCKCKCRSKRKEIPPSPSDKTDLPQNFFTVIYFQKRKDWLLIIGWKPPAATPKQRVFVYSCIAQSIISLFFNPTLSTDVGLCLRIFCMFVFLKSAGALGVWSPTQSVLPTACKVYISKRDLQVGTTYQNTLCSLRDM